MAARHLRLHKEYLKVSISTAMEYKANFLLQAFSMMVNDFVWLVFWFLLFYKFESIGGWVLKDLLLLQGILFISFGLSGVFLGNRMFIANIISEGKLDFYLTLPKNVLYHLLMSRCGWYEFGDIVAGIILLAIALPTASIPLAIMLIILSSIIYASFSVIAGSLAFFIGHSEQISWNLIMGNLSLSGYPFTIYKGVTRMIILTIIPAGFIAGVPVMLIKSFNTGWFILMIAATAVFLTIAIAIFYIGLKRYESGNLLYVRV